MKALRLVLIVLAVAAAGFLAFRGLKGNPLPEAEPPPAQKTDGEKPWNPLQDDSSASATPAANTGEPAPIPPAPPEPPIPGTAVNPDADVSVVVPYRTGTKTRYLVTEGYLAKERVSEVVQWHQYLWMIGTEVVQGDGTGKAKIRLTVESFRFRTDAPGRRIEFDSLHPDEKLLADKELTLARGMKPNMAILGMPLEFALDATGAITGIEGVEPMNRRYVEAVGALGPDALQDVTDAPTVENLTERWSEILFPPLGGGSMKASAPRDATFRTTIVERWANVVTGKLRPTHDDPGPFRVEFKGRHSVEELGRPATTPMAMAVAKVNVLSDADAYVASWRFDRESGRLMDSRVRSKYQVWIAQRAGNGANGVQFDRQFTDVERQTAVERLPD